MWSFCCVVILQWTRWMPLTVSRPAVRRGLCFSATIWTWTDSRYSSLRFLQNSSLCTVVRVPVVGDLSRHTAVGVVCSVFIFGELVCRRFLTTDLVISVVNICTTTVQCRVPAVLNCKRKVDYFFFYKPRKELNGWMAVF